MATMAAVTADGTSCTLDDVDIASLRSALRGEVIESRPGELRDRAPGVERRGRGGRVR